MDLDLSPEDLAFRDEVRAFLGEHLTPELRAAGRRMTSVFCEPRHSLPWQRILHARGWAAANWPKEQGGTGWNEMQRAIFAAECARAGAPGARAHGAPQRARAEWWPPGLFEAPGRQAWPREVECGPPGRARSARPPWACRAPAGEPPSQVER